MVKNLFLILQITSSAFNENLTQIQFLFFHFLLIGEQNPIEGLVIKITKGNPLKLQLLI